MARSLRRQAGKLEFSANHDVFVTVLVTAM